MNIQKARLKLNNVYPLLIYPIRKEKSIICCFTDISLHFPLTY